MNRIPILFIGCVALMTIGWTHAKVAPPQPVPAIVIKPAPPDLTKECAEDFKIYHECKDKKRLEEDNFRKERREDLTNAILQQCFAKNQCTAPQLPPLQAETTQQKACRDAYRAAKRAEILKCVNEAYPGYVLGGQKIDRSHVGDDHLLRLLGLSAEHCEKKQAVITCTLAQVEEFRKTRYQLNCGIKEHCRVLMSERCQDHHYKIKYAKCECKKQVKRIVPALRNIIPACRLVPPKQQRPVHECPSNGFCRAGYKEWLKHHPPHSFTKAAPALAAAQAFAAPVVAAAQAGAVPAAPAAQAVPGVPKVPPAAIAQPAVAAHAESTD